MSLATIATELPKYLDEIHDAMFARAKKTYDERIVKVDKWEDVVPTLNAKNVIILAWCEGSQCEDDIKERSAPVALEGHPQDEKAPSAGAKSLCIPFDQARFGELKEGTKCIGCGSPAKRWTMFGRSY
jgi:prolyl-tRNA synthetase